MLNRQRLMRAGPVWDFRDRTTKYRKQPHAK